MRAGRVIGDRAPVAIERVIEDSLQSSALHVGDSRLVVEKSIENELPLVLADEIALRHAIKNLVDNALKYGTGESHWIGISALHIQQGSSSAIEIRVADRGQGIPPNELTHIFDPFFRGSRALQDQIHGTGLGLNLVKRIVETHGGSISVKSEPMKGTEFLIRIPVAPPEFQHEFAHSLS